MPRIAVVDDQPDMRQQLCSMIDQYSRENNCMLEVTTFSDGAQIITNYCKGFDIIFLDIEMPELGGMDAAERIRTVDPDVVLVFVTNMAQYAIRGYEVDALDFVLKPVNYYQFSTKLARALQRVQRRKGGHAGYNNFEPQPDHGPAQVGGKAGIAAIILAERPQLVEIQHHNSQDSTQLDDNAEHFHKIFRIAKLQHLLGKDHMPGAGNRQPFGDAFNHTVNDGFQN